MPHDNEPPVEAIQGDARARLEVTEVDRKWAAFAGASIWNPLWATDLAESVLRGARDDTDLVQAFAHHRHAFASPAEPAPGAGGGEANPAFFKLYNALHGKISKARDDERSSVSISTKQLGEILDWAGTYQRMSHPSEQERETMAIIKRGADLIKPGAGEAVFYLRVGGERSQLSTHAAPGVEPQTMLSLAINALRAEAGDAAKCPVHTPSLPAGREAIAREARAAMQRLANTRMDMSLSDWGDVSSPLFAAIDAILAIGPSVAGSENLADEMRNLIQREERAMAAQLSEKGETK